VFCPVSVRVTLNQLSPVASVVNIRWISSQITLPATQPVPSLSARPSLGMHCNDPLLCRDMLGRGEANLNVRPTALLAKNTDLHSTTPSSAPTPTGTHGVWCLRVPPSSAGPVRRLLGLPPYIPTLVVLRQAATRLNSAARPATTGKHTSSLTISTCILWRRSFKRWRWGKGLV